MPMVVECWMIVSNKDNYGTPNWETETVFKQKLTMVDCQWTRKIQSCPVNIWEIFVTLVILWMSVGFCNGGVATRSGIA